MPKINCLLCNEELELNNINFYESKRNKDGYDHRCKECHKSKTRIYLREHYNPLKARLKAQKRRLAGLASDNFKRMTEKYPEKWRARYKLRNAVAAGKIKKLPCEVCGSEESQGHHDDYSKPFIVRWLCRKHHAIAHHK